MKKVYLAGPITGLSWNESEDWRNAFKRIAWSGAQYFSPLRHKDYLKSEDAIADGYRGSLFSSDKAIMERDFHDVLTSDAIVVNLVNAKKVSIGTVMEIAWAYQRRIPIIIISEPKCIHDHAMLRQAASWWVHSIKDAAKVIEAIFEP